jgi:hypothetical protein
MWARVIEVMLGCWLAVSPFIFRHSSEDRVLWFSDLLSALVIIVVVLVSFWPPLRFAHVANLAVALWLIAFGYWAPYPTPPALQNDIVVGLLLMMFAIIPNNANEPPQPWREFLIIRADRQDHSLL